MLTVREIDDFLKDISLKLNDGNKKTNRELAMKRVDEYLDLRLKLMHPESDDESRMDAELGELVRKANG